MSALPTLGADDLLTRGHFHDAVIPPLNAHGLAPAMGELKAFRLDKKVRSRCTRQSVPKRKHLRRLLSIPNPFHQVTLALEIEKHWTELEACCRLSRISLSVPTLSRDRALETSHSINEQPQHRCERSVGNRYVLRTDIARFYPSIYTHSVAWAIHGKDKARADHALWGNELDRRMSYTQDKQTGGIPIGPDTSLLIGEVMVSAIDINLQESMEIRGTRFIDDYYLHFDTQARAEHALAQLHKIAKEFELEINDPKTEIRELPEDLEPVWKTELRGMRLRPAGQPQATDLLSLFNRGFDLVKKFPGDSVLTYVARQVSSSDIDPANWKFCESLLMKAVIAEPTALKVVIGILTQNAGSISSKTNLTETVGSLCRYHAPLEQGFEVAWALWLAKQQELTINEDVARQIVQMDDDIVALAALDLRDIGLFPLIPVDKWKDQVDASNLYTEHWLLAYEASEQGWLSSSTDYVADDPGFSILRKHGVRFYDSGRAEIFSSTGY